MHPEVFQAPMSNVTSSQDSRGPLDSLSDEVMFPFLAGMGAQ